MGALTQTLDARTEVIPAVTAQPTRSWWRSPALLGTLGVGLVIALHLVLSAFMRVPIIQPDELGYLQNARFMARGGLRSETEYYPGFSLLLVPILLVSSAPTLVFHAALVVEALLGGTLAIIAWRLTRLLEPALSGWRRVLVAAITLAYPATLLYGDFTLAEVAFATVFGLLVLIAARAFTTAKPGWCFALGMCSGALALVHPRGFAVVVAVGIFGLLLFPRRITALAPLAAGIAISCVGTRALVVWTKGKVAPNFGAYRPDTVVSKSISIHGGLSLISELGGQLWYLTLATFGLVPLAMLLGGRALWKVLKGNRTPLVLIQGFIFLSYLGVWALSSMFMNLGDRADKLIYGRYNEGVVMPLLVIALADLLGTGVERHFRRRHNRAAARRWFSMTVICAAASGSLLYFGHTKAQLFGALNPANVLGLASLLNRMGDHIHVISMTAIAVGAVAVLALIAFRWPIVASVLLLGAFGWLVWDMQTTYLMPGTRARAQQDDIAIALRDVRKVPGVKLACVAWDADHSVDYNYYNDKFLDPEQNFAEFDSSKGQTPCGSLLVSTAADVPTRYPGAQVITEENYVDQRLWAIPLPNDPTFQALSAAGWLTPASLTQPSTPLPSPDLKGSVITVRPAGSLTIHSGGSETITVTIAHGPGGAPWPDVAALHSGSGADAFQLAVRWYAFGPVSEAAASCPIRTGPLMIVSCPNVDLPRTLLPGEHANLHVALQAVTDTGRPLAAGSYSVSLNLFQQSVGGFDDPGITIPVTVVR